jgi:hypothetical protein
MQRLRRNLFSWIAFFSLILLLFSVAMWPTSYWRTLTTSLHVGSADMRHDFSNDLDVDVTHGMISFHFGRDTRPAFAQEVARRQKFGIEGRGVDLSGQWTKESWLLYPLKHSFLGFAYEFESARGNGIDEPFEGILFGSLNPIWTTSFNGQVPLWVVVLITAVLPFWQIRSALRIHRQRKLGLCANCGYDLRATRERCPECGAVPSAPPQPLTLSLQLLIASVVLCIAIAAIWAASYSHGLQATVQAPLEELEDNVDRLAQFIVHDGRLVASVKRQADPIKDDELQHRRAHGTMNLDIVFDAHWQLRDEDGNFTFTDDPEFDQVWKGFAYSYVVGDDSHILRTPGLPPRPLRWRIAAFQCPLWSILLIAALLPAYKVARVIARLRRIRRRKPANNV